MEVNERELVRLTGLWKRRGKNGIEYYAGEMSKTTSLFLFPTRSSRSNGNKPEFIVYIGQTKGGGDDGIKLEGEEPSAAVSS